MLQGRYETDKLFDSILTLTYQMDPVEAVTNSETLVHIANPQVMLQVGTLQEDVILTEIASEARLKIERVEKAL